MSQPRKKGQPHKGWKDSARGKHAVVVPTENQMDHALAAFASAKDRYKLMQMGTTFVVAVQPENWTDLSASPLPSFDARRFPDEASARQWREREIIREAITAGMRAKP